MHRVDFLKFSFEDGGNVKTWFKMMQKSVFSNCILIDFDDRSNDSGRRFAFHGHLLLSCEHLLLLTHLLLLCKSQELLLSFGKLQNKMLN